MDSGCILLTVLVFLLLQQNTMVKKEVGELGGGGACL